MIVLFDTTGIPGLLLLSHYHLHILVHISGEPRCAQHLRGALAVGNVFRALYLVPMMMSTSAAHSERVQSPLGDLTATGIGSGRVVRCVCVCVCGVLSPMPHTYVYAYMHVRRGHQP